MTTSNNFYINSTITDGDIIFQGVDGGVGITALRLDMSSSGNAIFNNEVFLGDTKALTMGASDDFQIYHHADGFNQIVAKNDHPIQIKTASKNMVKAIPNGAVELYHNNSKKLETTSSGISVTGAVTATGGVAASGFSSDGHITAQYIYRTGVNGSGFHFTTNAIFPVNENGSLTNGSESLGHPSYKYNKVYANSYYGDGSNLTGISAGRTYGTTANTTSGTSFTFTGIPAGVYEVNLILNGVRVNGGYGFFLRLGTSSGIVSSGYQKQGAQSLLSSYNAALPNVASDFDTGFSCHNDHQSCYGIMKLVRTESSSNTWLYSLHMTGDSTTSTSYTNNQTYLAAGAITLSGELTQIQIVRERAGKTFQSGSATITWSQ